MTNKEIVEEAREVKEMVWREEERQRRDEMTPYERALDIVMTKDVSAKDIESAINAAVEEAEERWANIKDRYIERLEAENMALRRINANLNAALERYGKNLQQN